ncbi:MAG: hypothetical protein ACE5J7_03010 [Candidatus Aenigmatarchaeota archaeon]
MVEKGTKKNKEHVLEKVYRSLKDKGMSDKEIDSKMHAAMLLSYVGATYNVMDQKSLPTPLFRARWKKRDKKVEVEILKGRPKVPIPDSVEINALDLVLAHQMRDIPLLWLGESGTGKTHVTECFYATIARPENIYSLTLESGLTGSSVLDPFTRGVQEDGMSKLKILRESLDQYIGIFIDELTRGDTNDIIKIVDGLVVAGSERGRLGIPIPELKQGKLEYDGRKKKMQVVGAANPPNSRYSRAIDPDDAIKQRFQMYDFESIAQSAGSSLWRTDPVEGGHEKFIDLFKKRTSEYLGIDKSLFDGIEDDWVSLYAWITDSERTSKDQIYSALEFADMLGAAMSQGYSATAQEEQDELEAWSNMLENEYGIKFEFNFAVREDSDEVKKIYEVVNSMREPLVPRDIVKVKKMADAIKTIRELKTSFSNSDPFEKYMDILSKEEKRAITIADVAYSAVLLTTSKQKREEGIEYPDPSDLVNKTIKQYLELEEAYKKTFGVKVGTFDFNDPNRGIKNFALSQAVHGAVKMGRKGIRNTKDEEVVAAGDYSSALIYSLKEQVKKLTGLKDDSKPMRNIMLANIIGDLTTLAGFVGIYYKDDVNKAIASKADGYFDAKKKDPKYGATHKNVLPIEDAIKDVYDKKQKEQAIFFPDYFEHRLLRLFR